MGGALRDRCGGIVGLLTLPREQWQAIEADLLDRGFTYADVGSRVTWRALYAMVRHTRRGTALYSVVFGEAGQWGPAEHLTASLVDIQQVMLWMKTQDGQDGTNRPTPVRRPGAEAPEDQDTQHFGSSADAILVSEWDAWWDSEVVDV